MQAVIEGKPVSLGTNRCENCLFWKKLRGQEAETFKRVFNRDANNWGRCSNKSAIYLSTIELNTKQEKLIKPDYIVQRPVDTYRQADLYTKSTFLCTKYSSS